MPLSPPSDQEALFYYAGLPSAPRLVARTGGTPWEAPIGLEAYTVRKELLPGGTHHSLSKAWEHNLPFKLHALLDSEQVEWTSTDIVRIRPQREYGNHPMPVILWIGVKPSSLTGEKGVDVAFKCRELLMQYGIDDVEVEIRESVVSLSASPKLRRIHSEPITNARESVRSLSANSQLLMPESLL